MDVPFVAKAGAFGVEGALDAVGAAVDMDFALLDDHDNVLATSGNLGPQESLSAAVVPGRTYRYRVVGYANGPAQFTITSKQLQVVAAGGDGAGGGVSVGSGFLPHMTGVQTQTHLVRFTLNPLTRAVTAQVLR